MKRFLLIALILLAAGSTTGQEKRFTIPLNSSPSLGPADARVTMVEFIDFQ